MNTTTTNSTNYAGYESFEELYNKNYNQILNYINFKINKLNVAEEITNDVFVKVSKHLFEFNSDKSKFNTWLHNIANNTLIDYFRSDKTNLFINVSDFNNIINKKGLNENNINMRQTFDFQFTDNIKADTNIESQELMNSINKAFKTLKPKYLRIAELYFVEDKQYTEIAAICDIPLNSVKVMILRCREMLQAKLQTEKKLFNVC